MFSKSGKKLFRSFRFVASLSLLGVLGCSSGPQFRPATPLAEIPSFQEILWVCYEYQVAPEAARPNVLKPEIDCVEKAVERFPGHLEPWSGVFLKEFRTIYQTLQDLSWHPAYGREINIAYHAILRNLWRLGLPLKLLNQEAYSQEEKRLVLKHFPMTGLTLETGKWRTLNQVSVDMKLERFKAGMTSLILDPRETVPGSAASEVVQPNALLCQRWNELFGDLNYLASFSRDQLEMTQLAPRSRESEKARVRYAAKLEQALQLLEASRGGFEKARAESGFRVGACMSGSGRKRNA